ncbi:hypothetical protein GobsT_34780 [Gemmata obscuriglobus]|uniref:Uncharacterized protein n=1 Tax=Gemmata obscuriglobus TaxID=114 RepID=A0A2Z3GY85_9BACT|nr:hypothetical protein [Gemmata obscuriglobus]AWM38388.1 hypothetical protein C1280_16250 [Gemmata obscuriglobus]QEG28692.1 hypothetical protein GobsT_34780 [Gemmata obscuriglobus]VTS06947.1 unnamed protein product [Gemmata obscuriglobus UQM 2246]
MAQPLLILLGCCTCVVLLIPVLMFLLTFIYRWSCVLCGLPKPGVTVAAGIMFVSWVAFVLAVSLLRAGVHAACDAARLPPWEASIITFLLALPIDLLISAGVEAGLMGVRFGKAVEVWYTQRLIHLAIVVVIVLVASVVYLIQQFV